MTESYGPLQAGINARAGTTEPPGRILPTPRRGQDVELLGRVDHDAHEHPVWLVCVGGERYIHATSRLYHVLLYADGSRSEPEIAERVVADTGEETTPEQVAWLVQNRLEPAGLVAGESASSASRPAQMPLLAIRHRLPLLPPRVTGPSLRVLNHLFWPPFVVLAVGAALGINGWLYLGGGLQRGVLALLGQPAWLLLVLAIQIPQRMFHELGHASALRRGGVRHGVIGVALYVVIPVFYSDVTHSYRLPRRGRIRTDLAGMYFDCVSTAVFFTAYVLTGQPVLLLGIVMVGLGVLTEFTPFLRFDGYYLLADLIGVPDPMALFPVLLRDLWPTRWRSSRGLRLRRTARLVLLGYLFVVVVFLLRPALVLGALGDHLVGTILGQGPQLASGSLAAFRVGDWARLAVDVINLLSWALILVGIALFGSALLRVVWRGMGAAAKWVLRLATARLARREAGVDAQ